MRPIRDLDEIQRDSVLYHSAFGFARVRALNGEQARVEWEQPAEHLPDWVGLDSLRRIYNLCPPGGFFERALNATDELREALHVQPTQALQLLLEDLPGPQRPEDLREWTVQRGLLTEGAFDRWWGRVAPLLAEDNRFRVDEQGAVVVGQRADDDPHSRLKRDALSPARRLDIAVSHREALGETVYREQVLLAWSTGTPQVRNLALAALRDEPAEVVLSGLLNADRSGVDALIHALRHGGYTPEEVPRELQQELLERIVPPPRGAVDDEARLAATLARWGAPGIATALAGALGHRQGQRMVQATLASLPQRRGRALEHELVRAAEAQRDPAALRWLLERTETAPELRAELAAAHPTLADRVGSGSESPPAEGPSSDRYGVEAHDPQPLSSLQVGLAPELPRLGRAVARVLAGHHRRGEVLHPSLDGIWLMPDGRVEITRGKPFSGLFPEPPGPSADVHGAAVALIRALVGRGLPQDVLPERFLPYLRDVAPGLPPSALGPLAAALHPEPTQRACTDGDQWLGLWKACALAEQRRRAPNRRRAHSEPLGLSVGYDSHIGHLKLLQSQTNQDALWVSRKGPLTLMAVCDGISTAHTGSGDLASGITAQVVASLWEQWMPRLADLNPVDAHEFLTRALRMANQAVCEATMRLAGGDLGSRVPMGTTAVVAVGQGDHVTLAWLGDSRAYLVGAYGASLLTADANQAAERLVDWHHGRTDDWDAQGFALVRYVGHFDEMGESQALPTQQTSFRLLPGERLVLCTDGVTDYIAEGPAAATDLLGRAAREGAPDDAARALVELANRGGGGDNATAVVATCHGE